VTVLQARFGILSFAKGPLEEIVRHWRAAEALGFDSAWVDDDILTPGYADFEPWTLLGTLARETNRLRIGTLVTVITYRHPAVLASQVLTIDHASRGRVDFGIGAGGPPNAYGAVGLDPWSARERTERLEEQVAMLDRLLRGEPIVHEGQHYRAAVEALPAPLQQPRPPLIVAANGKRGLQLTARYADEWNSLAGQPFSSSMGGTGERVSLADAVVATQQLGERLSAYGDEIGRDPATIRRSILAYRANPDPLSSLDAFDEYTGRYLEIDIDGFMFYWPPLSTVFDDEPITSDQQSMFERIATERLPKLRARAMTAR
jgi:alkanesulfonate monooxygenase SsuD/methylene tetrahydromethanopterin reductase-like flavin-dependent oxidoreductase (luciferase family)